MALFDNLQSPKSDGPRTTSLMTAFGVALVVMVVVILLSFVSVCARAWSSRGRRATDHLSRGTVSRARVHATRAV